MDRRLAGVKESERPALGGLKREIACGSNAPEILDRIRTEAQHVDETMT